jgi:hypothetical protein
MWIKHKVRSLEFLKFDIGENIHFVQQKIYFAFSNVRVPGHSEKLTHRNIISALTFRGTFLYLNIFNKQHLIPNLAC